MARTPGPDPARSARARAVEHRGVARVAQDGLPAYRKPGAGRPVARLGAGQLYPHLQATADGAWLQVTLFSGNTAWVQASGVTDTPPDPGVVTLVLDPGHGGSDTGAVGPTGLQEKTANLDIALRLEARLAATGARIWLTRRDNDRDYALEYRSAFSKAAVLPELPGAPRRHLFLSLHNNSFNAASRGTETYYKCGTEATAETVARGKVLACRIQLRTLEQIRQWFEATGRCEPADRGVICRLLSAGDRRSYYHVLRHSDGAAALLEGVFVSNPAEEACLKEGAFRDRIAAACGTAIDEYLAGTGAVSGCWFREITGLGAPDPAPTGTCGCGLPPAPGQSPRRPGGKAGR